MPPVTIMLSFLTFLATSSLSYFVNYKQYLLSAYQRGYVIVRIFNITTITKIVLQMAALMWLGGGYASFLILEVVAAVVYSWLLERCVGREYPWLKPSFALGRSIKGEYFDILTSVFRPTNGISGLGSGSIVYALRRHSIKFSGCLIYIFLVISCYLHLFPHIYHNQC